jgi:hypothetical protein
MKNEPFTCPLRQCWSLDWYKYPPDPRCPHDAWVESVTISEPSSGERQENRGLEIHIRLLGAYQDGTIEFTYRGVQNYSMQAMRDVAGHGDWLEDEVDVKRHVPCCTRSRSPTAVLRLRPNTPSTDGPRFQPRLVASGCQLGGVENRRSGCSLPVARGGAFASPPQSGLTWLCFLFPLIEPDRRI